MFYDNYVELCKGRGVSPSSLAVMLGFSKGTYGQWKKGSTPTNPTLKTIADYFGVTVDELLHGKIEKPAPQTEDELNTEVIKLYGLLNATNQAAVLEIAKSLLSTQ